MNTLLALLLASLVGMSPQMEHILITDPPSIMTTQPSQPPNFTPREPEAELTIADVVGISEDDLELFAGIVNAEDGADSFDNKVAVACVIFNRMESEEYSGTVYEVITEKGQFSTYSHKRDCAYNPISGNTVEATEECKEAILYAYLYRPLPVDVLYFSAFDFFSNLEPYEKIGDNYFCYS